MTGILVDEAVKLNEKFICWHIKKRPFVHLKLAMSLDGRISINKSVSTALSCDDVRTRVQNLRHEYDAILVGGNTATVDNPSLTDRSGKLRRRPLMRVILDNRLQTPIDSVIANSAEEIPTMIFTNCIDLQKIGGLRDKGVDVIELESGGRDLAAVLANLNNREIQSVLVEGGTEIAGAFCDAGLVDKITFFVSPIIIGGKKAPNSVGGNGVDSLEDALKLKNITVNRIGDDIEISGYPKSA